MYFAFIATELVGIGYTLNGGLRVAFSIKRTKRSAASELSGKIGKIFLWPEFSIETAYRRESTVVSGFDPNSVVYLLLIQKY